MCGRAEWRDEEGVSIDTSHTHSLSPSIIPISSASLSLHLALHAVVLVVAPSPAASPAACSSSAPGLEIPLENRAGAHAVAYL